jgi:hypothetical protein
VARTGALRLGRLSGIVAIYVALWAMFAFLVVGGFAGGWSDGRTALLTPSLVLVFGLIVLFVITGAGGSMAALAAVEVAIAAGGFATVAEVAEQSSFWSRPFMLVFSVPPALLALGGICAAFEFLRRTVRGHEASASRQSRTVH